MSFSTAAISAWRVFGVVCIVDGVRLDAAQEHHGFQYLMIGDGHEYETAMLFAIANTFSPDGGEESDRTKVRQIIQKMRR